MYMQIWYYSRTKEAASQREIAEEKAATAKEAKQAIEMEKKKKFNGMKKRLANEK